MKIPTLSVFAIFALLGMALGMGGYGSYGYGASYVPVPVHPGYGGSGGVGDGGICKWLSSIELNHFKAYLIILHELKETKVIITKRVMCTL